MYNILASDFQGKYTSLIRSIILKAIFTLDFFFQGGNWSEKKNTYNLYEREASTRQNQVWNGDTKQYQYKSANNIL